MEHDVSNDLEAPAVNFLKKLWAKQWGKLVIMVLVFTVGAMTYLQLRSVRITLGLKPIPVPQDRLFQAPLAAIERITVKGATTLRPGTLYIDGVKVKIKGETALGLSGVLTPDRPGQSKSHSLDVQSAEATVKSGSVELEVGGVLAELNSVTATKSDGAAATVKLKLLQSLVAAISEKAVVAPNGPQATRLQRLIKEVNISDLAFEFKDQGTLPLPSGGSVVLHNGSVFNFQNFVWKADGSLSATATLGLKLAAGTVVPISEGVLRLATGELNASGQYARSGATETLTISTPTTPSDATAVPRLSLEGATIDVNSKLFASIGKADAAISGLTWKRSSGKESFQLAAGLQGVLKLPEVPVPGGSLSVGNLTLGQTVVTVSLGGPAPMMNAAVGAASAEAWTLRFKRGENEYKIEGRDAQLARVNVASFNGGDVVVPAGSVKLTRLAISGQGAGVSMSFDPKSTVSLSDGELRVPVLSTTGATPTMGHGNFKGEMREIRVNADGTPFNLSNVDSDVDFDLSGTPRVHGSVSFVGNANGVRDNIKAQLGPAGGFSVANLSVASIDANVGHISGNMRFDFLSDHKGTATVDVSAANCSVTAKGTGCGGELDIVATVPQLSAVISLATRQAAIESLITLDSRKEVCALTGHHDVWPATIRFWAQVQPFKVGIKAKMRVLIDSGGKIVCAIDSLSPNNPGEYIRVKVPVRHLPDPDDVIIKPFDTPRLEISFPLGITLHEPNPIRSAIQKLVGKSFVLKD